jgi:hypothetical protein
VRTPRGAHHTGGAVRQQRPRSARHIMPLENAPLVTLAAKGPDGYKALPPAFWPHTEAIADTLARPVLPLLSMERRLMEAAPVGA